jgi:hypothetical protein
LHNDPMWTQGKVGPALRFDGVNDYISVLNNGGLASACGSGQPRSWGYWIYYEGGSNKLITDKSSSFNGRHFWSESVSAGTSIRGGVAVTGARSTGVLEQNRWHHLLFTYDGTNTRLYLNGSLKSGPAAQTAPAVDSATLFIMGTTNTSYSCKGILDDVRIYNRALSAAEAVLLYNQGSPNLIFSPIRRRTGIITSSLSLIKTFFDITYANTKTIKGTINANTKTFNGITNV